MKKNTCFTVFITCFILLGAAILPCYSQYYHDSVEQCESNLSTICRALDDYARDNRGEYPPSLSYLVPRYIAAIPNCPSIGIDTYSCGYMPGKNEYVVCCFGKNHKLLLDNQPVYTRKGKQSPSIPYTRSTDSEKTLDTATSLILLGILAVVSFLVYRKR